MLPEMFTTTRDWGIHLRHRQTWHEVTLGGLLGIDAHLPERVGRKAKLLRQGLGLALETLNRLGLDACFGRAFLLGAQAPVDL